MMKHDWMVALRNLLKFKMQNLIAILGVSVALLCFSLCLYCSRYIFSTDDCFENRDRILEVWEQTDEDLADCTLANFMKEQSMGNYTVCVVDYPKSCFFTVPSSDGKLLPYELTLIESDSTFQSVFTPTILSGSWENTAHSINAVVLVKSVAIRIFGSVENAVGKQMILGDKESYLVQAVMEDLPMNTSLKFLGKLDGLVVNDRQGLSLKARRRFALCKGIYLLPSEKMPAGQIIREFNEKKWYNPALGYEVKLTVNKFGTDFWENSVAKYWGYATLIAGILILLVGLFNFFHFLVGSFFTRIREYNIRRVTGAGFYALFRMLLIQMGCAVLVSGLLIFLMVELLTPFLNLRLSYVAIEIQPGQLMWQILGYLLALFLMCGVICMVIVYKVQRIPMQSGLLGSIGRYNRHTVRNILLAIQLFVGWLFLSVAVALYLQAGYVGETVLNSLSSDEKERILGVKLNYPFLNQQQRIYLIDQINEIPDVEAVLKTSGALVYIGYARNFLWENEDRGMTQQGLGVNYVQVHPGFFDFMHLSVLSGKKPETQSEMMIDSKLAEKMNQEVLGKVFYELMGAYTVAGVCSSTVFMSKEIAENGFIFLPATAVEYCYVRCREGKEAQVQAQVERLLQEMLPENITCQVQTLQEEIDESQTIEVELRSIVLCMAFVALLISMLGIYSAITLDTEHRRKEVAIRKINGAGVWQIVQLFARLYVVLLVVSALFAFPLVELILRKLSQGFAFFIPTGIGFYCAVFLSVLLLVVLTVYVRIRNVAKVNPAEVIKRE